MPHPAITWAMVATLIVAIVAYRQLLIVMVGEYGLSVGALAFAICYALALAIHHRETRGY